MANSEGKVVTVGVTGVSGAILAQAALRLLEADPRVARPGEEQSEGGLAARPSEFTSWPLC